MLFAFFFDQRIVFNGMLFNFFEIYFVSLFFLLDDERIVFLSFPLDFFVFLKILKVGVIFLLDSFNTSL